MMKSKQCTPPCLKESYYCSKSEKGEPCPPCAELASVDKEIAEAEALVNTLKAKRMIILRQRNNAHDSLTSDLPVEVVCRIFASVLPIDASGNFTLCLNRPTPPSSLKKFRQRRASTQARGPIRMITPLSLGAVSTAWRTIAWAAPELWNSISVSMFPANECYIATVRDWLGRSGKLPLYISINFFGRSPYDLDYKGAKSLLYDTLAQYVDRWFHLTLGTHGNWLPDFVFSNLHQAVMLQTLKFDSENSRAILYDANINLAFNPSLRTISTFRIIPFRNLINVKWENLTHLDTSYLTLHDFFDLFSKAIFLTHFSMLKINPYADDEDGLEDEDEDDSATFVAPQAIIKHGHLRYLSIQSWSPSTDVALTWMALPALQHLSINKRSETILTLLDRSPGPCPLKTLELNLQNLGDHNNELEMVDFLFEIASLETLTIRDLDYINNTHGRQDIHPLLVELQNNVWTEDGWPQCLPSLRTLSIDHLPICWETLVGMVSEHANCVPCIATATPFPPGENIRPLSTVRVRQWGAIDCDDASKGAFPRDRRLAEGVLWALGLDETRDGIKLFVEPHRADSRVSFEDFLRKI
ncbi:hypothetical protein BDN70DRAFT_880741 [Pholiota conissans]|uniref:F-box domain-containing protein n=1 Tax=Pholiota conissans TaxID=109636 RepID=A0A9P6CSW9_9AGAR|nr:hypothetical protein BDN70DRAFT_880741 [Pholiota conissans]